MALPFHKFGIGLDEIFRHFETVETLNEKYTYPPYNIIKKDQFNYLIEIAMAGFTEDEIDVELKENVLTVTGRVKPDQNTPEYLYKGIAKREFARAFQLADSIEITAAAFTHGMLRIHLENVVPEHKKPRKISITTEEKVLTNETPHRISIDANSVEHSAAASTH